MMDVALGICIGVTAANLLAMYLLTSETRSRLKHATEQSEHARKVLTDDVNRAVASTEAALAKMEPRIAHLEGIETRKAQSTFMPGVPRRGG